MGHNIQMSACFNCLIGVKSNVNIYILILGNSFMFKIIRMKVKCLKLLPDRGLYFLSTEDKSENLIKSAM